jgi:DNA-binding CsgD family transcriptional regulator
MGRLSLAEPLDPELGAALMDAVGTSGFGPHLLHAAQQCDFVEEVFAYRISEGGEPDILASSSGLERAEERADYYARRFYRHDPARSLWMKTSVGSVFAGRIGAEQIPLYDYRAICFERPHFVDKLSFGWRGRDQSLFFSLYRSREGDDCALARLSGLASVALAAMARAPVPIEAQSDPVERLSQRLLRSFPQLSARELEVCARTLTGHRAERIAADLGISRASVLTYRQRAYQRYGFSSASDFLPAVLD